MHVSVHGPTSGSSTAPSGRSIASSKPQIDAHAATAAESTDASAPLAARARKFRIADDDSRGTARLGVSSFHRSKLKRATTYR
jgi:hypothetical protein